MAFKAIALGWFSVFHMRRFCIIRMDEAIFWENWIERDHASAASLRIPTIADTCFD
jgi:hypothetical protein